MRRDAELLVELVENSGGLSNITMGITEITGAGTVLVRADESRKEKWPGGIRHTATSSTATARNSFPPTRRLGLTGLITYPDCGHKYIDPQP